MCVATVGTHTSIRSICIVSCPSNFIGVDAEKSSSERKNSTERKIEAKIVGNKQIGYLI